MEDKYIEKIPEYVAWNSDKIPVGYRALRQQSEKLNHKIGVHKLSFLPLPPKSVKRPSFPHRATEWILYKDSICFSFSKRQSKKRR